VSWDGLFFLFVLFPLGSNGLFQRLQLLSGGMDAMYHNSSSGTGCIINLPKEFEYNACISSLSVYLLLFARLALCGIFPNLRIIGSLLIIVECFDFIKRFRSFLK
jgi:hypothetical protein